MPSIDGCSIYDKNCRDKVCSHISEPTAAPKQRDYTIDIISTTGVPFRVVYGNRTYGCGCCESKPVVAFYDRRYDFTDHGQFVSDYDPRTLLSRESGGLNLYGGVPNWTVDHANMATILAWLETLIENLP